MLFHEWCRVYDQRQVIHLIHDVISSQESINCSEVHTYTPYNVLLTWGVMVAEFLEFCPAIACFFPDYNLGEQDGPSFNNRQLSTNTPAQFQNTWPYNWRALALTQLWTGVWGTAAKSLVTWWLCLRFQFAQLLIPIDRFEIWLPLISINLFS